MARGASPCRGTSRRCRCRPTRPSSTRSSGSGSACANASSRIACSTATRPCSMLPATPGTPSPRGPAGSPVSPPTLICSDQNFGEPVYSSIFTGQRDVEIASARKKLTIFFSDIVDFTATTDDLESEELTSLLNRYLTEMSKIALEHGATIDKYIGDAFVAFFGDPETRGVRQDAVACVGMAIAMQRRMRELQSEWRDAGLERPFQLRIGVNTG